MTRNHPMQPFSITIEICALCGRSLEPDRHRVDSLELALSGATRYSWCLVCLGVVPAPWSESYRRRWDQMFEEQQQVRDVDRVAGTQVGRTLRNTPGTRIRFYLRLTGSIY